MAKSQNGPASVTESVTMDTRKFLSAINNSAQTQVAFFEDAVSRLGEKHGREWALTALHSNKLFLEDRENHEYFIADHSREKGGRIKIANIRKVEFREDKKPELFENSCLALVEAIEKEDPKDIETAYNKIAASRFRSTAIPSNGVVKTKDGVIRQIPVQEETSLGERILGVLSDNIVINEDGTTEGLFATESVDAAKLGVSELTTRKLVAKHMREAAASAHKSENFQILIESIAGLICKDELDKAVQFAGKFLKEHQEFCLLGEQQWDQLASNALATRACFNEDLARDTATLLRKTNLKVNRDELVDAWRKTAERAQHPVMLENVDALATAENFEEAYEQFLPVILETGGETTRGALIAGLEMLKQKVSAGDVDEPTVAELDQLIQDLKTKGDSASTWKAMDTLDGVRRSLDNLKGLDDFDAMPGPGEADEETVADEARITTDTGTGAAGVAGAADKPLEINIKMDPARMAAGAQEASKPAEEDEFDLGSLEDIDVEEPEPREGEEKDEEKDEEQDDLGDLESLLAAGKDPKDNAISEDEVKKFLASEFPEDEKAVNEGGLMENEQAESPKDGSVTEEDEDEESDGGDAEYALPEGLEGPGIDMDYQTIVLEEIFSDSDVTDFDDKLEDGTDDPDAMQAAAEAWIRENRPDKIAGVANPEEQKKAVLDLAGQLLARRQAMRQGMESKDTTEASIEEDQYKSPLRQLARRGFKRAAINKLVKEGNLRWLDRSEEGVLGEFKGIKFIIDHSEDPLAVLSEDGQIVIDVPKQHVAGAMYASEASDEEAEADSFVEWLDAIIESLNRQKDKSVDDEIAAVEGKLPPHLEKYKFKPKGKGGEAKDKGKGDEGDEGDEGDGGDEGDESGRDESDEEDEEIPPEVKE